MPDSNLIDSLDALQSSYSQRQKQASALLVAVKNAVTASAKLNKSLTDFAPQSAVKDKLEQAQQALNSISLKEAVSDLVTADLRREIKLLTTIGDALKVALLALRGDSVDVVKLGHAVKALHTANATDEALIQLLPALQTELTRAENTLADSFGRDLRDALAARDIQIGGRGSQFEIGRFELNVIFEDRTSSLSYGKTLVVPRIPISVDAVLKAYDGAVKLITGRNEDGTIWLKQLYEAWANARRGRETADQRANIIDCYFGLFLARQKKSFRSAPRKAAVVEYTRAEFAYDLYEFIHRQHITLDGLEVNVHGATRTEAESDERGLWIVEGSSPHAGRYVSSIEFKKSN
jgi:hypothetical protein